MALLQSVVGSSDDAPMFITNVICLQDSIKMPDRTPTGMEERQRASQWRQWMEDTWATALGK